VITIFGTVMGIATMAASGVGLGAVMKFLYEHEFKFGKTEDVRSPMHSRPGMERHTDMKRKGAVHHLTETN
jgi:hypothetical protein